MHSKSVFLTCITLLVSDYEQYTQSQFESRRHSMYREEALEALVMALTADENPKAQLEAAKVFATLGGRFSYSGKSLDEAWLLKTAGMAESYHRAMKDDQGPWSEDMVLNPVCVPAFSFPMISGLGLIFHSIRLLINSSGGEPNVQSSFCLNFRMRERGWLLSGISVYHMPFLGPMGEKCLKR